MHPTLKQLGVSKTPLPLLSYATVASTFAAGDDPAGVTSGRGLELYIPATLVELMSDAVEQLLRERRQSVVLNRGAACR